MKITIFLLMAFLSCGFAYPSFDLVPVSYQGRFLPTKSYSKQWLYGLSHQNYLTVNPPLTPLDLLWQMHFFGHGPLDHLPLFWIEHQATKQLFFLNEKENNFSYQDLKNSLESQVSNLMILKRMLIYHFKKAFQSPENRSRNTILELSSLAPGLWLKWKDKILSVLSSPSAFPWQWLGSNKVIAEGISLSTLESDRIDRPIVEEIERLIAELLKFERQTGSQLAEENLVDQLYSQLKKKGESPKEIHLTLEQHYPLHSRLVKAGNLLKVLPGKFKPGEWYSLHALHAKSYNPNTQQLELAKNFTLYPDSLFEEIRDRYFNFERAILNQENAVAEMAKEQLGQLLMEGYESLSKNSYANALGKTLYYPSILKLKAENFYAQYPLILICMIGYVLALSLFLLGLLLNRSIILFFAAYTLTVVAFSLHTFLLLLRCYILGRPPVANMFETVLYVPWVAVLLSLLLRLVYKTPFPLIASTLASSVLLLLVRLNFNPNNFENIQAVLDSHYWLLIHVLMVVGSYGLFLLSSLLGHIYLAGIAYYVCETAPLRLVAKVMLQLLYIGVALLVVGTLLGGVWAAQSWGRFWDWDPKESWAFISICIYLLWIHAYRFGKIHHFGIALGAIFGFLAISFTWYGVNYILGTGLHSYGFGNGGIYYYYSFIFAELVFLIAMMLSFRVPKNIDKKTPIC